MHRPGCQRQDTRFYTYFLTYWYLVARCMYTATSSFRIQEYNNVNNLRTTNESENGIVLYFSLRLRPSDENIEIIFDRAPVEGKVLRVKLEYFLVSTNDCTVHAATRAYSDR